MRTERVDRVLVDHRADVDAEHALRGNARRGGVCHWEPATESASATPTTSAANSAADGTPIRVSG